MFVVEKDGTIRIVKGDQAAPHAVPRHLVEDPGLRQRAGAARAGVPPALRRERPLLRRLHRQRRPQHRRAVPGLGRSGPRRPGDRRDPALDRRSGPEPQRRDGRVRPGRQALGRHRRRRRLRRPVPERPEPPGAARQDAPPGRGRRRAVRHPGRQPVRRQLGVPARRSGRWGCATPGATASTAPTATSGSATSARTPSRRSTGCRAAARAA